MKWLLTRRAAWRVRAAPAQVRSCPTNFLMLVKYSFEFEKTCSCEFLTMMVLKLLTDIEVIGISPHPLDGSTSSMAFVGDNG